jgi:RNA polymerase sigma-70 factor (ECF subfamily)
MATAAAPQLHFLEPLSETGPASDRELVVRAKGDAQAFAALYRRYANSVYRYCYHRLGCQAAAEDATSEVFIKAFTKIGTCREDGSFRSWIFAIAHNTVLDSHRAGRDNQSIESAASLHDPASGPEDSALWADSEQSVLRLLAELRPQQARIIELRLAGLTGPEIARVLGCSLAAVKIGQVRGYGRLRSLLGNGVSSEGETHD